MLTPLEQKFVSACRETTSQRDADGKVRWLYMVNWVVSVLKSENSNMDAEQFYKSISD